jgi:hypothetical protein
MSATSPAKARRNLRIDRSTYPMAGTCEHCGQRFLSRNEDLGIAAQHLREQFDSHKCELGNKRR